MKIPWKKWLKKGWDKLRKKADDWFHKKTGHTLLLAGLALYSTGCTIMRPVMHPVAVNGEPGIGVTAKFQLEEKWRFNILGTDSYETPAWVKNSPRWIRPGAYLASWYGQAWKDTPDQMLVVHMFGAYKANAFGFGDWFDAQFVGEDDNNDSSNEDDQKRTSTSSNTIIITGDNNTVIVNGEAGSQQESGQ